MKEDASTKMGPSQPDIATANLMASFKVSGSRRKLLKIAAAGVAGVAVAGAAGSQLLLPAGSAHASGSGEGAETSVKDILSIAATAERLAITFYSHGIANADTLGIRGQELEWLEAAVIEEQIHELFFVANGGVPITSTFSFPHAGETFRDLNTFIATQQQLEGVFDSAFLAAIKEFAYLGLPRLAQIAGQIACIESEHRVLGRVIGKLHPADNWAYAPVFVESVSDAPAVVAGAGYLSPKPGNSYMYQQVSTADEGVMFVTPFTVGEDKD
ncbi:MAG: hypothetical protein NVS9B9_07880 [Ktedonobacteraceae bacterium]